MSKLAFAPTARTIAVVDGIALQAISLWQIFTSLGNTDILALGPYCFCIGLLVALIEAPSCCTCFPWCVVVAKYLRYISGYWISRGVIYILASAGGYAIYQLRHDSGGSGEVWILLTLVALTVSASLYLLAALRGEAAPGAPKAEGDGSSAKSGSTGASKNGAGGGGGGGFLGFFGGGKAAAVGAAAAGGATAPSMGEQMFGGAFAGSPGAGNEAAAAMAGSLASAAVSSGAAGALLTHAVSSGQGASSLGAWLDSDEPAGSSSGAAAAPASGSGGLFGGTGSLFSGAAGGGGGSGGGSSGAAKYGYTSDAPESNPFMSSMG